MTDTPALQRRRRTGACAPVQSPDHLLIFDLLGVLARRFSADPASFLTEVNSALELRDAVHHGYKPQRKSVTAPSRAVLAFAEVTDEAARYFLELGNPARSPNALPAGLGISGGEVGADSQMAPSSEPDEITSGQAAELLGVSAERVRQLARKHHIGGGRTTPAGTSGMWPAPT